MGAVIDKIWVAAQEIASLPAWLIFLTVVATCMNPVDAAPVPDIMMQGAGNGLDIWFMENATALPGKVMSTLSFPDESRMLSSSPVSPSADAGLQGECISESFAISMLRDLSWFVLGFCALRLYLAGDRLLTSSRTQAVKQC
jgi:hypothetical protein